MEEKSSMRTFRVSLRKEMVDLVGIAHWIVAGAVVLLGVGVLSGVKATRQKDVS